MTLPPSGPDPSEGNPAARFIGWLLMAVGGLIAALCGLCTLVFAGIGVASPSSGAGLALVAFVLGGVPTAIGIGVFILGLHLVRTSRPKKPPPTDVFN